MGCGRLEWDVDEVWWDVGGVVGLALVLMEVLMMIMLENITASQWKIECVLILLLRKMTIDKGTFIFKISNGLVNFSSVRNYKSCGFNNSIF